MTTTITTDSLLPRLKLDCDVGYDADVKGASVVVYVYNMMIHFKHVDVSTFHECIILIPFVSFCLKHI